MLSNKNKKNQTNLKWIVRQLNLAFSIANKEVRTDLRRLSLPKPRQTVYSKITARGTTGSKTNKPGLLSVARGTGQLSVVEHVLSVWGPWIQPNAHTKLSLGD